MILHRVLILLFLHLSAGQLAAQQKEFLYKNLTQEEGLPSNEVYYIFRDSKAYLWIATDKGVVRYNGSKMERFELPDNVVFKIFEDDRHRIWFFTHTGALSYYSNGKIFPYQHNRQIQDQIPNLLITNALVDSLDNIWLNSAFETNYMISGKGVITLSHYKNSKKPIDSISIIEVKQGKLFAQKQKYSYNTTRHLAIEVILKTKRKNFQIDLPRPTFSTQYSAILADSYIFLFIDKYLVRLDPDGLYKILEMPSPILCVQHKKNTQGIFIGTVKGAFLLSFDLKIIHTPQFLSGMGITSILEDNENGAWFATLENGVYYCKNILISQLKKNPGPDQPVYRLFNCQDTALLFANSNGIYKISDTSIRHILPGKYEYIYNLFAYNKTLYLSRRLAEDTNMALTSKTHIAGFNKLYILNNSTSIIFTAPDSIISYSGEDIFVLDSAGRSKKHGKIFSPIRLLYKDVSDSLWAGSDLGMQRLSISSNFSLSKAPVSSLLSSSITAINQLSNGIYGIALRFNGLVIMKDTSVIKHITTDNSLASNSITGIITIGNNFWTTSPQGITIIHFKSYSPITYDIINIGKNEGLFNMVIYQLAQFKGSIYAATSKGLYCIDDPDSFIDKKPTPIPFYLSAVNYHKGDTSNIKQLSVPYTKNRVRLSLSAVCYNIPDSLHFYYRINEQEENWQELTGPELLLENLSPGDYKIELKAAIPHLSRSSAVQTFFLTIEKPWWQNNWFRLGVVLLIGSVIFLFIRFRIKRIQNSEEQKRSLHTKMNELKQISLKAQMNPHFIFNCLTSIQQLIVTGDAREANDALVKFSRLIRKTLELSSELYISIAAEKEYLAEYIALEQLRFPNQFTADFVIDETIDTYTTLIPGMLLQPIIENSIRHGVKHLQERKGRITISIQEQESTIVCTVRDNGTGRDSSNANATSHKSYGTRIIQQRLDNLAELEGISSISLEIKDLRDGDIIAGTEVTLRLPYKSVTK